MASKDERKLARTIVDLSRRLDASHTRQIPFTSVELDDGTEQGLADGVTAAVDAYGLVETHDSNLADLSDVSDNSAIESTFTPERLAISEGGSDSAFELGMAAVGRVSKAQAAADQAATDALAAAQKGQQAFEAAAEATEKSAAAETAAAEAMDTATQAAGDVITKTAAAEAAAKEYAQAQAAAAQAEAIAAASGDASDKAASAQAAAIAAAAEDAAIKAAQAEAAAKEVANAAKADAEAAIADAAKALADASSALSKADRAQATADGRNRVFAQALNPVAPPGIPFVGGDLWYRTETVNGVVRFAGVNMWNGTEWKPYQLVADSLLVPGSIGAVLIKNGEITGPKLAVDALNFKSATGMDLVSATITAGLIKTAATGRRMEFNTSGLAAFNSSGTLMSSLTPQDYGFLVSGGFVLRPGPTSSVPDPPYVSLMTTGLVIQKSLTSGGTEASARLSASFLQLFGPPNRGAEGNPGGYVRLKAGGDIMDEGAGTVGLEMINTAGGSNRGVVSMNGPSTGRPNGDLSVMAFQGDVVVGPSYANPSGRLVFTTPPYTPNDRDFGRLDNIIGASLGSGMIHGVNSLYVGLQAAIRANVLYITGRLERSGGIPANHVLFTLPTWLRPSVPLAVYAYSSAGDNFVVMQPNGQCILAIASGLYVTISMMPIPLGA